MDKIFKDKSSQSPDFNSPIKLLRSEEEPELELLEKSSQKNKLLKSSHKALWADTMLPNQEEKAWLISRDSKFSFSEENFQSYSDPSQKANDNILYLNISIFEFLTFISIFICCFYFHNLHFQSIHSQLKCE